MSQQHKEERRMSDRSDEIRRILDTNDHDFHRWSEQHREFESRLAELASKSALTEDEELEEKQLKKRKLWLKDMMADRIRKYETTH
jgi:uncharacterized protein